MFDIVKKFFLGEEEVNPWKDCRDVDLRENQRILSEFRASSDRVSSLQVSSMRRWQERLQKEGMGQ